MSDPEFRAPRIGEVVHYVDYSLPEPGRIHGPVCLPAIVTANDCTWVDEGETFGHDEIALAILTPLADKGVQHIGGRSASHLVHKPSTWHWADHA